MTDPASNNVITKRLKAFLDTRLSEPFAIENLRKFSVGFSWITYGFDLIHESERQSLILRLAPEVGILPRYLAEPEAALLKTIAPTGLPTPRVLFASDTPDAFGTPYLICTRCPGEPFLLSRKVIAERPELLRTLAHQFIERLAVLHRAEWQDGPYGRYAQQITRESAALTEVGYWWAAYEKARMRMEPSMQWIYQWLLRNVPTAPRLSLVHGDYRIGNFLTEGDRITGILDFEMSHPGDPHDDIAYAFLPEFNGMSDKIFGVMDRKEALSYYCDRSGMTVDPKTLHYYGVLARFKLAVICFCGLWKFRTGQSADARMNFMGSQRARTVKSALNMTKAF